MRLLKYKRVNCAAKTKRSDIWSSENEDVRNGTMTKPGSESSEHSAGNVGSEDTSQEAEAHRVPLTSATDSPRLALGKSTGVRAS